jgi:hypothetical protein
MPTSARRRQPTIALAAAIALVSGCKQAQHHKDAAAVARPIDAVRPVDAAPSADADHENKISITVEKPRTPGTGFAKRCAIAGDPLTSDCVGGGEGLAVDKAGAVYLVAGDHVQRYHRADGPDCRLEPTGEPIKLPPDNPRPQRIDGPVYMRSGGPAWHLARLGDAIYALDFLGGLFRIDRGKPEPACTDVFGYDSIAQVGAHILIARKGIEQLALGGHCKARSAHIDDKARGEVYAINNKLYSAIAGNGEVTRYDSAAKVKVVDDKQLCSAVGLAACGDGVCIVDNNCMKIVQVAADGTPRVIDDHALFDQRPWSISTAVTQPDGSMLLLAKHRDTTGGNEVCEAAVYQLPAALFER